MLVVLISPHGSIIAYGLRLLSSCLGKAGHRVRMIFLPFPEEIEPIPGRQERLRYPQRLLDEIVALCRGAGLIGITSSTLQAPRVALLSDYLRERLSIPVVLGGIDPTIDPEGTLAHGDFVCVGEGEKTIVELAEALEKGGAVSSIGNLVYRDSEGKPVHNPLNPLVENLDALPYPDYRIEEHFLLHQGRVVPMTEPLALWHLTDGYTFGNGSAYHIWATRGCPHRCAYCGNSVYHGLYPSWGRVRRMSPERIVAEVEAMRRLMPFVSEVAFMDDTFFSASDLEIESFASCYKERVDLPFFACTSPTTLTERKLKALVEAGLKYVWMGIQSGSPRVQAIYRRNNRPEQIVKAAALLSQAVPRIRPPVFDIIMDPFFQNPEDQRLTLRLLAELPRPFQLALYSMTLFPGTEITGRALAEGRVEKADIDPEKSLVRLERNSYRVLLWLLGRGLPKVFTGLLTRPLVFRFLRSGIFNPLWGLLGALLDRKEGKQLLSWTWAHRVRVMKRFFPSFSTEDLSVPHLGGRRR